MEDSLWAGTSDTSLGSFSSRAGDAARSGGGAAVGGGGGGGGVVVGGPMSDL